MKIIAKFILLFIFHWLVYVLIFLIFKATFWSKTFYGSIVDLFLIIEVITAMIISLIVNKYYLKLPFKIILLNEFISIISFILVLYYLIGQALSHWNSVW